MKKFYVLLLASILATLSGIPYILALLQDALKSSPLPLPVIVLLILGQTSILLAITIFFGLRLADKIGFNSHFSWTKEKLWPILRFSVPTGIATGIAISIGDALFSYATPTISTTNNDIAIWKILMIAPYGGLVEELLLRLFIVSLLVWLLAKLLKVAEPMNHSSIVWSAIIIASILFGIGHLPATAAITPITPLIVLRAIVLNGIGGLVFGWLYWKKGLQFAIITHFTVDIVLLVAIPLLLRSL